MNTKVAALAAGIVLILTIAPAFAHHAVDANFDLTKFVTLTGTVTKAEWVNPHSSLYIDVKGPDGKSVNWTVEMESSDMMTKAGWTRDSVKSGDQVKIDGWLAKDGSRRAHADSITLTRTLMMGSKSTTSDTRRTKPAY